MRLRTSAVAFTALIAGGAAGHALELEETTAIEATPAAVWARASDFCAVAQWHPAYRSCKLSEVTGKLRRILFTTQGARIVERLIARDDAQMFYTYKLDLGPLPVKNYVASFRVFTEGGKTYVTWDAKFDASGVSENRARQIVHELFQRGLQGLKSKF
jgi:Polyketide cyclase / dehydrase and lipid transport